MAHPKALCVYCASSDRGPAAHRDAANLMGRLLADAGVTVICGGGGIGLMGAVADGALDAGGEVVGVIPRFLERREVEHANLTRLEVVASMHERKARMAELSDGFVILPGGLGTLDEAFEIITWRQLALHDKPVIVVDINGYWQPLRALIDHVVDNGYADDAQAGHIHFVDRIEAVLSTIKALSAPNIEIAAERP
jgi:uncharacterized protein (TIGR00730 family)